MGGVLVRVETTVVASEKDSMSSALKLQAENHKKQLQAQEAEHLSKVSGLEKELGEQQQAHGKQVEKMEADASLLHKEHAQALQKEYKAHASALSSANEAAHAMLRSAQTKHAASHSGRGDAWSPLVTLCDASMIDM